MVLVREGRFLPETLMALPAEDVLDYYSIIQTEDEIRQENEERALQRAVVHNG